MLYYSHQACGSRGKALLEKAIRNNVSVSAANMWFILQIWVLYCLWILGIYWRLTWFVILTTLMVLSCRSDYMRAVFWRMLDHGEWRLCLWMVSFWLITWFDANCYYKCCVHICGAVNLCSQQMAPCECFCSVLLWFTDASWRVLHICHILYLTTVYILFLNVVSDVLFYLKHLTRESFDVPHRKPEVRCWTEYFS